jgi:hypothetical protein
VDGRFLVKLILDGDLDALALPHPDFRARDGAVVGPDRSLGIRGADQSRAPGTGDEIIFRARGGSVWPTQQECSDSSTAPRRQKRPAGKRKNSGLVHLRTSPSDGAGLAGSGVPKQSPSASSGRVATRSPTSAGDQASDKGEDLRRTMIGAVQPAA